MSEPPPPLVGRRLVAHVLDWLACYPWTQFLSSVIATWTPLPGPWLAWPMGIFTGLICFETLCGRSFGKWVTGLRLEPSRGFLLRRFARATCKYGLAPLSLLAWPMLGKPLHEWLLGGVVTREQRASSPVSRWSLGIGTLLVMLLAAAWFVLVATGLQLNHEKLEGTGLTREHLVAEEQPFPPAPDGAGVRVWIDNFEFQVPSSIDGEPAWQWKLIVGYGRPRTEAGVPERAFLVNGLHLTLPAHRSQLKELVFKGWSPRRQQEWSTRDDPTTLAWSPLDAGRSVIATDNKRRTLGSEGLFLLHHHHVGERIHVHRTAVRNPKHEGHRLEFLQVANEEDHAGIWIAVPDDFPDSIVHDVIGSLRHAPVTEDDVLAIDPTSLSANELANLYRQELLHDVRRLETVAAVIAQAEVDGSPWMKHVLARHLASAAKDDERFADQAASVAHWIHPELGPAE